MKPTEFATHWNRVRSGTAAALSLIACAGYAFHARCETNAFRVGFTSGMFFNVNENDARAAVKAWGQSVAKQNGIDTDPQTQIFKDGAAALPALKTGQVDVIGMSILEYLDLSTGVAFDPVFVTYSSGQPTEQYFLIVRREDNIREIGDLRGRSLIAYQDARSCLALPWMDLVLDKEVNSSASEFVGQIVKSVTLSKTVIPVFFRQADACVVTRSGFETMVELNPQLGKELTILARSEELVPAVFAFRAAYNPSFREKLMKGLADLHRSAAGQQILTLFHCERIAPQPGEFLRPTSEMVRLHSKLVKPNTNAFPIVGISPVSEKKGEQ